KSVAAIRKPISGVLFASLFLSILTGQRFGQITGFILEYNNNNNIYICIESMSKINKLTTSFIKITNAMDKVKNQDEYNIYVSMLDEEDLDCIKYVQRLRKYTHRQLSALPRRIPTRASRRRRRGGGKIRLLMTTYFRRSRLRQKS
ncbi:MAG: hypothetical protein ACKPKO_15600, partial [Candidatus Fonsibacter sp.]